MNRSAGKKHEFSSGIGFIDVTKWMGKMFGISYLVLILMIYLIIVPMFLMNGDILTGFITGSLVAGFMALTIPFMIPFLFFGAGLRYLVIYRNCSNSVKIIGNDMVITLQRAPLYPLMKNTIPLKLIDRIEGADIDYLSQRKERTPFWYRWLSFYHRIPIGGLYMHHISKKDLLVVRLKEPLTITNNDYSNILNRGLEFKSFPVMEVIVNVKRGDQDRFREIISSLRKESR